MEDVGPCWMIGWTPIWMFPKIGEKNPKWMVKVMENPIKMDDLGVPLFSETSMSQNYSKIWLLMHVKLTPAISRRQC